MAKASRKTPQQPKGFVRITHRRCPDCDERGALHSDGRPITSGGALRPTTKHVGRLKKTYGCETCEGVGELEIDPKSAESIDPYAQKIKK